MCTGAFLLARAGLLDGRRATTHWAACEALQRTYPTIAVDPDPIFVRDGNVYTSAGVTAGIDLALALVEEDLGRQAALEVARALVLFIRRPGGQAQFSAGLAGQQAQRPSVRELQDWIAEHLDERPVRGRAGRALVHEPAQLRPRVRPRGRGARPPSTSRRFASSARGRCWRPPTCSSRRSPGAAGSGRSRRCRRAFGRRLRVSPSDYRTRFTAAPAQPSDNVIPIRSAAR